MAEESKQKFDPDATVAQPAAGAGRDLDPEATVALPMAGLDPEATVSGPLVPPEPDPEATFTGPAAKRPAELDATDLRAAFDPDATVNPAERLNLDPDATVRVPSPGRIRKNPFAPKSTPETIQANLATLGGLNALIALANPILGAVPQIRRTLKHPDPAGLRASLRDQIESLQTSASFAGVSDEAMQTATYALCALLDESAGATPWGSTWIENGLLKEVCGESGGGQGFFTRLEGISTAPDPTDADNADLLEFFDVCLALGFEGRYRKAEGGRQALLDVRSNLYALIARRRPRPSALSARWRSATAEAAAAPALQMAAEIAARVSAQHAAAAAGTPDAEITLPPVRPSLLSRISRRAVWSGLAGVIGVMLVVYLAALRLLDSETKALLSPVVKTKPGSSGAPGGAPAPAPLAASARLAKALEGAPVAVTEEGGRILLALRHDRQFASGAIQPAADLQPVLQKIAAALEGIPGAITVTGHADTAPTSRYASNTDLSAARARAVAKLMTPQLSAPARLSVEGKGDAQPIAPGSTPEDRARNRRVTISVRPNP